MPVEYAELSIFDGLGTNSQSSVFSEKHFGQLFRPKADQIGFNGGNFLLSVTVDPGRLPSYR
jgi:hypothetical protein